MQARVKGDREERGGKEGERDVGKSEREGGNVKEVHKIIHEQCCIILILISHVHDCTLEVVVFRDSLSLGKVLVRLPG